MRWVASVPDYPPSDVPILDVNTNFDANGRPIGTPKSNAPKIASTALQVRWRIPTSGLAHIRGSSRAFGIRPRSSFPQIVAGSCTVAPCWSTPCQVSSSASGKERITRDSGSFTGSSRSNS